MTPLLSVKAPVTRPGLYYITSTALRDVVPGYVDSPGFCRSEKRQHTVLIRWLSQAWQLMQYIFWVPARGPISRPLAASPAR